MDFIFDPSLAFYLPLHELDGSSFRSRDAYGHLCTVTGATWGVQGRTFDGTDDKILVSSITPPSGALSLFCWFKVLNSSSGALLSLNSASANQTMRIEATLEYKGSDNNSRRWAFDGRDGNWHCACLTTPGSAQADISSSVLIVDGVVKAVSSTTATGAPAARNAFQIATESSGSYFLKAIIGEVRMYSRVLTPQEIQYIYLATKWRYR